MPSCAARVVEVRIEARHVELRAPWMCDVTGLCRGLVVSCQLLDCVALFVEGGKHRLDLSKWREWINLIGRVGGGSVSVEISVMLDMMAA